jgi:hypothetical protein
MKNSDFISNGLTKSNSSIVFPILIKMKKYDDLFNLISNSKNVLSSYHCQFYSNYLNVLKFKCIDSLKSINYVLQNVDFINSEIKNNPRDSMKIFDYLTFKALFISKKLAVQELDSIRLTKNFSPMFCDYMVLKSIQQLDTTEFNCK